jgi:hypothetical protein
VARNRRTVQRDFAIAARVGRCASGRAGPTLTEMPSAVLVPPTSPAKALRHSTLQTRLQQPHPSHGSRVRHVWNGGFFSPEPFSLICKTETPSRPRKSSLLAVRHIHRATTSSAGNQQRQSPPPKSAWSLDDDSPDSTLSPSPGKHKIGR